MFLSLMLASLVMFLMVIVMAISIWIVFPGTRWALVMLIYIHRRFTNCFRKFLEKSITICNRIDPYDPELKSATPEQKKPWWAGVAEGTVKSHLSEQEKPWQKATKKKTAKPSWLEEDVFTA